MKRKFVNEDDYPPYHVLSDDIYKALIDIVIAAQKLENAAPVLHPFAIHDLIERLHEYKALL